MSATAVAATFGLSCWAIIVVITGLLARRRGRLVRSWVASAIFFGIFALAVLAFLPPQRREPTNS